MAGAQEPGAVSTKQQRIAKLAGEHPDRAFTSLAHYIDLDWLMEAYHRTRKDGAVGVDGQTAETYGADVIANLQGLLERAKSGLYRAPPVRRVHIPKGDGKQTRPIGIPTFEDKVLQRAVAMVLEPLYPKFRSSQGDFSYKRLRPPQENSKLAPSLARFSTGRVVSRYIV